MSGSIEIKVIRKRSSEVRPASVVSAGVTCPERDKCREILETVIRSLVDFPESIAVSYYTGERTTVFKVECDQKCLGQIIGSKGKNISGVRAVVAAMMARKGIRAIVEIPYYCIET